MSNVLDKAAKVTHPYYSFDKIYSFNATYMFVNGGRGLGKTYGAKRKAIRAAIDKGEEFIYLRRYKSEMSARNTFFADIAHEFPDYDFRVDGIKAEYSPATYRDEKKRPWTVMGYFAALSVGQTMKGMSFPKVTLIIYDEYIIEKGALHYLPDESNVFNNFYSTVDRWKDKTRVLFLANSVSIMNPYFTAYAIRPDKGEEFQKLYNGFIAVHFADSSEFASSVYQTKFGQFIKGTSYADYSVGNDFSDANDKLLDFKDEQARYAYTLETPQGAFSVWVNSISGKWYVQAKRPRKEVLYVSEAYMMEEGKILMQNTDKLMQYLRSAFKRGMMYFDTPTTRNLFVDMSQRR